MHHTIRKVLTRKYLVISTVVLLLYSLAGFIVAPWIIRWGIPAYAQQNLQCLADVDTIRINPFLLTIEVNGFSLQQPDGLPLVAFSRLFVDLETSSLFRRALVVREVDLDQPDIHLVLEADGSINLKKLAATPTQPPGQAESKSAPLPFILQGVTVREGRITVADKRQSTPPKFTLQGLSLQLKDVSTVKDQNGICHLAATTEAGESIQWDGEIALAPFRSTGKFSLNTIRMASLWQFVRDDTNLEQPGGQINLSAEYHVNAGNVPVEMTLEGLRVTFADLSLKLLNTDKAFLQLKKMELDAPRFDLATKDLHVARLLLEEGAVEARINDTGGMNWRQIVRESLPEKQSGKKAPPSAAPPAPSGSGAGQEVATGNDPAFKVQADAIEVKNIALNLDDRSRESPFKAAIAGLDLHLQASLELGADLTMVLREIASEVRGASVHSSQSREPLFTAEKLTAEGGFCDLDARSFTLARFAVSKGRFDAGRDADGTVNWQRLLRVKGAGEYAQAAPPSPAWKFLVKSFEVEGFSSKFSDLTTSSDKPVLSLQNFKARLTDVDGASPMGFTVGFQVEQGGSATVSGTVNPSLPSVEADVNVTDLVLTSLQPYIEPYVTLQMHSAAIAAQGRLRYGIPGDKQQAAYEGSFSLNNLRLAESGSSAKPYLSWNAVQLPTCKLTLEPDRLEAQEIRISKPVGELIIGEDKTLNLVKVLKKRPGGTEPSPSSKPASKQAGQKKDQAAFPYHIATVRVDQGNVVFADLSLRPRFKTRIHDLKGTITGLSSAQNAQAKVRMDGQVDRYGMAKISGTIRPNDFGRSSDITMVFRNVEMKNLSPYSGRFAGRLIQSGKFSADLKYTLLDYKMTGDNKIVIDNLLLGEQVDHPEAANLPLDLAIALLKDSSGRIDIGLPVTGDLNDPQFSIGPLVWKMFTNLITKAATSPFRALGNLLGGEAENFGALEFDAGNADLLPPEKEKLLKIADALRSRPQLKLVIQGRFSPETDGMELKERSVRRIVAIRMGAKPGPNDNPEPLEFADSDTQDTLEQLYAERFGKASLDELEQGIEAGTVTPRMPVQNQGENAREAGMFSRMADSLKLYKIIPGGKSREQAVLWAGELHARLVEGETIADKAFLRLADKRAQSIAAHLTGEARIPKDRVSVTAPEPLAGNEQPSVTLSLDAL